MENKERDLGYDFIRFFAMLLIIISHLFTTYNEFSYNVPLIFKKIVFRGAINWGSVGVALFFMLSGALLFKRYENNIQLGNFYTKRFLRIEIPQWIGFLSAFALVYCVRIEILNTDPIGIFISFLGLNYFGVPWIEYFGVKTVWVIGEWFTAVIIFLYVIFPILRNLLIKNSLISSIIVTIIFLLNFKYNFLTSKSGWFSITNGIMCFWLGMLFEKYKNKIQYNDFILNINYIFLISFWYLNPLDILGIKYLSCFVFSVSLFIALYQINYKNSFTNYICKYNYEIYLVHHRIYILFLPALLNKNSSGMQIVIASVIVILITFLLSEKLQQLSEFLIKKLISKNK